jgi:GT2 family glycosyltransferase
VAYLPEFLHALRTQTLLARDGFDLRFYVIDGNSTDGSFEFLQDAVENFDQLEVVCNPEKFVSPGLNRAVKIALDDGVDYVVRMDIHARYPADYLEKVVLRSRFLELDGVKLGNYGGVLSTLPGDDTDKAYVIARVLSSRFGVGSSLFRIGAAEVVSVDTVPFGCFPRRVFDDVGLFDCELVRNQDDEFNGRLKKADYAVMLDPDIVVEYFARSDYSRTTKMFYQYGLFKPLVNRKLGAAATTRQYVPAAFVLGLLLSFLLAPVSFLPLIFLFFSYVIFAAFFYLLDVRDSDRSSISLAVSAVVALFLVHTSYGLGYCRGLLNRAFGISFNNVSASR